MFRRLVGCVRAAVVALLTSWPATAALAQTGVVRGIVVDAATHARIPFARVTVAGTTLSAITANDGGYQITGVPTGEQTIEVARAGFEPGNSGCRRIAASDTARVAIPVVAIGSDTSLARTGYVFVRTPTNPHFIVLRGPVAPTSQIPAYVIDGMVFPAGHAPTRALSFITDRIQGIEVDTTPEAIASFGVCSVTSVIIVRMRPPDR